MVDGIHNLLICLVLFSDGHLEFFLGANLQRLAQGKDQNRKPKFTRKPARFSPVM